MHLGVCSNVAMQTTKAEHDPEVDETHLHDSADVYKSRQRQQDEEAGMPNTNKELEKVIDADLGEGWLGLDMDRSEGVAEGMEEVESTRKRLGTVSLEEPECRRSPGPQRDHAHREGGANSSKGLGGKPGQPDIAAATLEVAAKAMHAQAKKAVAINASGFAKSTSSCGKLLKARSMSERGGTT